MTFTPEDIEAEHMAALASLSTEQWKAIVRIGQAKNIQGDPDLTIRQVFEAEAKQRNRAML